MLKILTYILTVIAFLLNAGPVVALGLTGGQSASIKVSGKANIIDFRVENLRSFLERYNSPLASHAQDFVNYADQNGIDYRLVPAIAGVESTFGKRIPKGSYNAYGWANGDYKFMSWSDSIKHVSSTLKSEYIDKGAPSISKIAKRYAPPSTTWAGKVEYFMGKIDPLPLPFDIIS